MPQKCPKRNAALRSSWLVFATPHSTDHGGIMSRRIRFALALVLVSFALTASACADSSGPSGVCDQNNPNTCH